MYLNPTGISKNYNIRIKTIETVSIAALFLFSFLNPTSLMIFLVGILFLLYRKEVGAVMIVNLVIFRTIINSDIAINIGFVQNPKWLVLFACSAYLLLAFLKLPNQDRAKIKWVIAFTLIFAIYNAFVAFTFSSLPVVATTKTISYTFIFLGVLIGVAYTKDKIDWVDWMSKIFACLVLASLLISPFPTAKRVNGISLQGVIDHPNMFGIVATMFMALVLSKLHRKISSPFWIAMIPITLFLIIQSKSRTAFIASLCILVIFGLTKLIKRSSYLKMAALTISAIPLVIFYPQIHSFFLEFVYKDQTVGNLLYSREDQIGTLLANFQMNPWFGMGFSVPVLDVKYYGFGMDFIVEPGNLILAVLSFSGIIGFCIFLFFLISVLVSNKKNLITNSYLFITPILISFGEMVFFSSNSVGLFCFMFLSLFIFTGTQGEEEIDKLKKRRRKIVW